MAVGASTAADSVRGRSRVSPQRPVRTCIGCRQRTSATELLRVVVAPETTGEATFEGPVRAESGVQLVARGARQSSDPLDGGPVALPVVPDPRRRLPGRGAWLHPDPQCVALAERRRAFGRALRVSAPLEPAAVREYVAQAQPDQLDQHDQHDQHDAHRRTQEMKS